MPSHYQPYLNIVVCEDANEAVAKGFIYPEHEPLEILQCVVVERGTKEGNATVDIILQGKDGQKYAVTTSAALLGTIPHVSFRS